ncbi:MAG: putative glycolipid-binding domain-containing protein [Gemmatimonadales bacterium]
MTEELVCWRRLDCPGHEAARLTFHDPFWHLSGTAVFAEEGQPCRLEYVIACSAAWYTLRANVTGWVGRRCVRLNIVRDPSHRWRLNGRACGEVDGCADLDLAFSPSTNSLPIRRLGLSIGQRAEVTAACLRFPALILEPLAQAYQRVEDRRYRYESLADHFTADLEVNAAGIVVRYPGLWEAEPVQLR